MFCIYNATGKTYKSNRGFWKSAPTMGYETLPAARAQLKKERRESPTITFEIHEIATRIIHKEK